MIELFSAQTGNVFKVLVALEEMGLAYESKAIDIAAGDQFNPQFLKMFPNNKVPAIIDRAPADGGSPVSVFESGAILIYLAEKTGRFLRQDIRGRAETLEWLMWQMSGLGPMLGQLHYFMYFATERNPHAIERYHTEMKRLYRVLNSQLQDKEFICSEYSIADMACFGWVLYHDLHGLDLLTVPHVARWFSVMSGRPAIRRALGGFSPSPPQITDEVRRTLFLQR